MKIRMIRDWFWRGGMLRKNNEYNMPPASCRVLIDSGKAEEVLSGEVATVSPASETAVLEKPRRRKSANPSAKRTKNG